MEVFVALTLSTFFHLLIPDRWFIIVIWMFNTVIMTIHFNNLFNHERRGEDMET